MSSESTIKNHSGMWYLAPIFLGVLGGLVMYLVVKDDDPKMAKKGLIIGLILTAISVIAYVPLVIIGFAFI